MWSEICTNTAGLDRPGGRWPSNRDSTRSKAKMEDANKSQPPKPSPGPPQASDSARQTVSLRSRPLKFEHFRVTFPQEKVVQVTLTRPDKLNCVDKATSREIAGIWEAFDQDESLLVGVITGEGRAFCTGADLHGACFDFFSLRCPVSDECRPSGTSACMDVGVRTACR